MSRNEKLIFRGKLLLVVFLLLLITFNLSSALYAGNYDSDLEIIFNKSCQFKNSEINLTGLVDNGNLSLPQLWMEGKLFSYDISIGKKNLRQGPGYFNQLLLSESGPSLKVIQTDSTHDLFGQTWKAKQLVAFLDEGVNKRLFVHRLENSTLASRLTIGISEAMMASECIHPAYYMPIPYWPYYLTAKLLGLDSEYNKYEDKYIGFDFTYTFANKAKIYGELLVDEYPMHSWVNNPDKRAHLFGFVYPGYNDLEYRLEYSNVFNEVYSHRFNQNNFTYQGELIGHQLGPDADSIDFEIKKILTEGQYYTVGLCYHRRGIGDIESEIKGNFEEKKFLSKVTEKEKLLKLGYNHWLSENIKMKVNLDWGRLWQLNDGEKGVLKIGGEISIET